MISQCCEQPVKTAVVLTVGKDISTHNNTGWGTSHESGELVLRSTQNAMFSTEAKRC